MALYILVQFCAFLMACVSLRTNLVYPKRMMRGFGSASMIGKRNMVVAMTTSTKTKCDAYAETYHRHRESTLLSYSVICVVGLLGNIILRLMNSFRCFRRSDLLACVFNRTPGRGLLTVSNHQSVLDDPGIWTALLPFWRLRPRQLRWVLCTEDVFFAKRWLTRIFALGRVLPLDRSGSMDQPMFQLFQRKLAAGEWCHIFPEGKVWQNWRFSGNSTEPVLGTFKYGMGKLVAHCYPNVPIVLPMYHRGMSGVIPEKGAALQRSITEDANQVVNGNSSEFAAKRKAHRPSPPQSLIPRCGNKIECYFGEALNFTDTVAAFDREHPGELQGWRTSTHLLRLYEEITLSVRASVLKLEAEAYNRKSTPVPAAVEEQCVDTVKAGVPAAIESTARATRELLEL